MEQINEIYKTLLELKLVDNEADFCAVFCKRHVKFLKDSNYHNFNPTLEVLLNIRGMIKHLYDTYAADRQGNYISHAETDLQRCLSLITKAIEDHHSDTLIKLTEVILHRPEMQEF